MKNKKNFLAIALLSVAVLVVLYAGWQKSRVVYAENEKVSLEYNTAQEERRIKINELLGAIEADFPGIVAYGDSLTAGAGGDGETYPVILQQLVQDNVYEIPVINRGVGGENTNTIMGRTGSVPFVVNSFTIPADNTNVEIGLLSSNGGAVAPLRQGEGGINPVKINGVEGVISIEQESSTSKDYKYFFKRSQSGEASEVTDGTIVEVANLTEFNNYIPIVFMGQNGGYDGDQGLVDQINTILEMEKSNEKYLVLGLTTGSASSRSNLESTMESTYGNRYINLREYIVENGLEQAGIEATTEDLAAINVGSIPPSLLSDPVHFNANGYKVIANAIYERMWELGYFEHVLQTAEEIKELKS